MFLFHDDFIFKNFILFYNKVDQLLLILNRFACLLPILKCYFLVSMSFN